MPPKMTVEPLRIFIRNGDDGDYLEITNAKSVYLEELADSDEMYNAEKTFWNMDPFTITFKCDTAHIRFILRIGSNSNNRRMHGKRPFRMRCYHRWVRHEILRRYLDR